jgi:hypothetical protein
MKIQFGTGSLLLATAFASIWAGGAIALLKEGWRTEVDGSFMIWLLLDLSPAWVPVAFLGYVIGRRNITVKFVLVFAATEIALIGAMIWIQHHV